MKAVVRTLAVGVLLAVMVQSAGCSTYWSNRGGDLMDIFDVGVTTSSEPGFSLYAGILNVLTLGYSNVDGTFFGMTAGQAGAVEMRQNAWGLLLWGKEQFGYESFDRSDPQSPEAWRVGVIGLIQGPGPRGDQVLNCPKMLHLGWIGLTINCSFSELADFLLGWGSLDIMGDDRPPAPKSRVTRRMPTPEGPEAELG